MAVISLAQELLMVENLENYWETHYEDDLRLRVVLHGEWRLLVCSDTSQLISNPSELEQINKLPKALDRHTLLPAWKSSFVHNNIQHGAVCSGYLVLRDLV
jgi:hypothetical protein